MRKLRKERVGIVLGHTASKCRNLVSDPSRLALASVKAEKEEMVMSVCVRKGGSRVQGERVKSEPFSLPVGSPVRHS